MEDIIKNIVSKINTQFESKINESAQAMQSKLESFFNGPMEECKKLEAQLEKIPKNELEKEENIPLVQNYYSRAKLLDNIIQTVNLQSTIVSSFAQNSLDECINDGVKDFKEEKNEEKFETHVNNCYVYSINYNTPAAEKMLSSTLEQIGQQMKDMKF